MTQLDLILQGEAGKSEGMARAWDHADVAWRGAAATIVRDLARTHAEFTTDHVWQQLDALGYSTTEHRAMGAVMRAAALDGVIVKTDRVAPSTRPCSHRRPVAIWRATPTPAPCA